MVRQTFHTVLPVYFKGKFVMTIHKDNNLCHQHGDKYVSATVTFAQIYLKAKNNRVHKTCSF